MLQNYPSVLHIGNTHFKVYTLVSPPQTICGVQAAPESPQQCVYSALESASIRHGDPLKSYKAAHSHDPL